MHVLDEDVIYKVTKHNTVEIIAGIPFGCSKDTYKKLNSPIDMSFGSDGSLYVLENDSFNQIKQISLIKTDGDSEIIFGENSYLKNGYSFDSSTSGIIKFNDPIAIAVHQNKSIYVLDKGNFCIFRESGFKHRSFNCQKCPYYVLHSSLC